MRLSNLVKKELIIKDTIAKNRDEIIKEVVHYLKEKGFIDNEKEMGRKLIERENQATTAVADGIAIPHCKSKNLEEPVLAVAISKDGVDFNSPDKTPTYLFFFLMTPENQPAKHLQILALIARLAKKGFALTKKILKAKNEQEILEIIKAEELSESNGK